MGSSGMDLHRRRDQNDVRYHDHNREGRVNWGGAIQKGERKKRIDERV